MGPDLAIYDKYVKNPPNWSACLGFGHGSTF